MQPWDYLMVTASNEAQARAYESQLTLRRQGGSLSGIREVIVLGDPGGQRIGSGGSTLYCLMTVLNRELKLLQRPEAEDMTLTKILRGLRILIIHAGGDSRRLPAYSPCGKIFVPVPGAGESTLGTTLFDRILPGFSALPPGAEGQVVVTSGDALILFDAARANLAKPGLTALGSPATPEAAGKHGVFCLGQRGEVRLYLQKPDFAEQARCGAIGPDGQSILDIGVMSFDAPTAVALLKAFEVEWRPGNQLGWSESMRQTILAKGLDIYREVCCALGSEASAAHHFASARASGSKWDETTLARVYHALEGLPFHIEVLPSCHFLHFGTTHQMITSGLELMRLDQVAPLPNDLLGLNNDLQPGGDLHGQCAWVEGCRISAPLTLDGQNVVAGVDVNEPTTLPLRACLDVMFGHSRNGSAVWFVRAYGLNDTFKDAVHRGATFCNLPLLQWLSIMGAKEDEIWDPAISPAERTLWNARVFPAEIQSAGYHKWLWMYDPLSATTDQKRAFQTAERYSSAEIAMLADQNDFHTRRQLIRRRCP